jgi:hypothetical protein
MAEGAVVTIYLERAVDVIDDDRPYDPLAPYARPQFYAHIVWLGGSMPNECEVRLSEYGDPMIRITPRQLDEDGDLYFPLESLETAIDKIRQRTEENRRAQAERVGVKLDIEGEAEEG